MSACPTAFRSSLLPTPYSLLPTPYSLLPTPHTPHPTPSKIARVRSVRPNLTYRRFIVRE
ncbi:hypothetical protein FKQ52_09400 [Brevundimonas sp. M20]|nr:hypothetical protein FKQ52_09400 [Brevundimonas sp. M20]